MELDVALRIGYEGGDFKAFLERGTSPERLHLSRGGSDAPLTWRQLLESELRPNLWLRLFPLFVHERLRSHVEAELNALEDPDSLAYERWRRVLRPGLDMFDCSETAQALIASGGFWNFPREAATRAAIRSLERELLEPIAAQFGEITRTYGFAGPALIREVKRRAREQGRTPNITPSADQHAGYELDTKGRPISKVGGQAVDLMVAGVSSEVVVEWVAANLPFDRICVYSAARPFHLSWSPEPHGRIDRMVPTDGGLLRRVTIRAGRRRR